MAFLRQQEPILSRPAPFSPEETASLIAASRKPMLLAQMLKGDPEETQPVSDAEEARETNPEDLGYVGVRDSGLARQAGDYIKRNREEKQRLLRELKEL